MKSTMFWNVIVNLTSHLPLVFFLKNKLCQFVPLNIVLLFRFSDSVPGFLVLVPVCAIAKPDSDNPKGADRSRENCLSEQLPGTVIQQNLVFKTQPTWSTPSLASVNLENIRNLSKNLENGVIIFLKRRKMWMVLVEKLEQTNYWQQEVPSCYWRVEVVRNNLLCLKCDSYY